MKIMVGKGSKPRKVDPKKYSENWEKIFGKPTKPIVPSKSLPEVDAIYDTMKWTDYDRTPER